MLEIITNSDANIVSTNGLKAGVQVWQKKTKHRLSKGLRFFFKQSSAVLYLTLVPDAPRQIVGEYLGEQE